MEVYNVIAVSHSGKVGRTEMTKSSWMSGFTLKERENAELGERLGLEQVELVIRYGKGRCGQFGHV